MEVSDSYYYWETAKKLFLIITIKIYKNGIIFCVSFCIVCHLSLLRLKYTHIIIYFGMIFTIPT